MLAQGISFCFRQRNVRVPTVLSFVAPLHVLITKNHANLEGMTFRQNATHRLDVKRVQLLSNVNEERNIAVVMQQQIMQLLLSDYQIQLIDSLNWLQMPLSNFPKTLVYIYLRIPKVTFHLNLIQLKIKIMLARCLPLRITIQT